MARTFCLIVGVLASIIISSSPAPAKALIKAGVASMITPVSAVKYYQQVVDYIGEKLGMSSEMVHRTTYDEIDVMLGNSEVDLAFICSSPYVLDREKFGVELLVAPQVNDKVYYHSYIIVHKESPIESFEQLRRSVFAFMDPKSNTGRLYPTYYLAKINETPENFFDSFIYSYSHNKSVEIVAKKRADGAAVDSIVYDFMVATNSPYTQQTKIIHRSPRFGIPPVVVPPDISPYLKQSLRNIFLEMHNDPEGKRILAGMKIQKFVEVPDSNYDAIRAMRSFLKNSVQANTLKPRLQPAHTNKSILFGVLPRDNPIIAYERYQPLIDYLTKVTGENIELHLEKTYKTVVNRVGEGKLSFALLGPLTYLDAYKRFNTSPIAKSKTAKGEDSFRSAIVTEKSSEIRNISELGNRQFAFSALWSTSGNLIPRYMLAWEGIHLDDLGNFQHYNYHDTVAKKVIAREFDAGAIRLSTAERYSPYGLRIIATSDPIPTGPVVVSPHTPYPLMQKVQKALLGMADTREGKEVLNKLDPDLQGGFVPASDADYRQIREMINAVPTTCGIGCHPKSSF